MKNKKISIIVPVYNVQKYLDKCLKSIISQTLTDIEIILVDDGSTDSSGLICDKYAKKDKRIKVIHQKNARQGAARNAGIKLATGDYIGFVDSDDYITSDMFEKLYKKAYIYDADIVMCDYANVKNGIVKYHRSRIAKQFLRIMGFFDIKKINPQPDSRGKFAIMSSCCNKIFKKDLAKKYLHFPEKLSFEDSTPVFHTLAMANKIAVVNERLYFYVSNQSTTKSNDARVLDLITVDSMMVDNLHNFDYGYFTKFCVIGLIRDVFRHFHKIDKKFQYEYFSRLKDLLLKMKKYNLLKYLGFKHRLKAFIYMHFGFKISKMISKI
ncbi:MAG: glycosyltransferase family 2 protein [Alphaproteobacteria bacterium]|nr:glycosyltransferase family 2 protein [Alphaproteobacteria bacterium]